MSSNSVFLVARKIKGSLGLPRGMSFLFYKIRELFLLSPSNSARRTLTQYRKLRSSENRRCRRSAKASIKKEIQRNTEQTETRRISIFLYQFIRNFPSCLKVCSMFSSTPERARCRSNLWSVVVEKKNPFTMLHFTV